MTIPSRPPPDVARLFDALTLSPDPVFVTDRQNRIVFWNRSAERILGYTADEAVGTGCYGTLEGCDVHGNRYCLETCPVTQMAAREQTIRQFDLHLKARDGRIVQVDVSILSFVDPPDSIYLAHVLRPRHQAFAPVHAVPDEAPAPKSQLLSARESPDARARRLTAREVEVLGMLAAGHGTPDIASHLHISNVTARNHIQNILDKLEVHSKTEAVAFAFQKRLL